MSNRIKRLTGEIEKMTAGGIRLDDKTLFYIESTFGKATPEFLGHYLCRSDDAETDTLFELIFFPDAIFQAGLEALLSAEAFSTADIDPAAEYLVRKKWAPPVVFPGGEICRGIVPRAAIRQFICRLNIARRIDFRVAESITDRFADDAMIRRCRVQLRNGRFPFQPSIVVFLCRLFSRLPAENEDFLSILQFAVDFLDHSKNEMDICTALMNRKQHLLRMIHLAEKCEKDMREHPMELLILRGISITSVDMEKVLWQMAVIDQIGLAVYGETDRTEPAAPRTQTIDLSTSGKGPDIETVIKLLS